MKQRYFSGIVALALCLGATMAQAQYYNYPAPPAGAYPPPPAGPYPPPPAGPYPPPPPGPYFAPAAGPYFRFGLGPSFFENGQLTSFGVPTSIGMQYNTGFASGAAVGYAFNQYIATEFELGFVGAEINNVQTPNFFSANSYIYNVPFLVNIRLSNPIPRSIVTPYIGAGVGGSVVDFNTDGFGYNFSAVYGDESDTVFAWQAFAGLRFQLNPNMSLGIGYKYFATDNPSFTYPPDNFTVSFKGVQTQSVLFTFEWKFW